MSNLRDKKSIVEWLAKYGIEGYILVPDDIYGYVVDVIGSVYLSNKKLTTIPIKFNFVDGDFMCNLNSLISLENSPVSVSRDFYCDENHLTSLEHCPTSVIGDFSCRNNKLSSLDYFPHSVGGSFACSYNRLTSLEYCPSYVGGNFYCNCNNLTSLVGGPEHVGGSYFCNDNQLFDFIGCPKSVSRHFDCNNNPQLGEYQKIKDFKEVEEILAIQKEKDLLQANVEEGALSNLHKI